MRIVCPNCSAAYDVPDGMLTGRQAVSCARCGQEWRPAEAAALPPPEPQAALPLEPPPPPPWPPVEAAAPERRGMAGGDWAIDRLMAAPPSPHGPSVALGLAWVASVVVIVALLAGGYVWRADLMAVWPPSVRFYAALGLR